MTTQAFKVSERTPLRRVTLSNSKQVAALWEAKRKASIPDGRITVNLYLGTVEADRTTLAMIRDTCRILAREYRDACMGKRHTLGAEVAFLGKGNTHHALAKLLDG